MRLLVRAAAALSGAAGAWLALGAVAVAPGETVASRVGVLPPWWLLGVLAASSLLLVFGARVSPRRAFPLFGALLCALPWMPGEVPAALLAWQGLLAACVWTGVIVAVVAAEPVPVPASVRAWTDAPSRAPWLAAALAAVIFAFAWRGTAEWLPGGDEPHYLIITQSLLTDGDLRIENNHRRGDYAAYYPVELKPDYLRRGADGEIYSIHAPGISALVAPAFLAGGYRGAAVFVLLCCALGTALAWRLAWETTGDPGAAWFGWAALALPLPIVAHAFTIFPDGVSGVLVLVGTFAFLRARGAPTWPLTAAGVALALLPWLHTRNAVIAAGLGAAIAVRVLAARELPLPARGRRLAAFLAVPVVAAAGWFAYFRVIYGTFDPSAPYGGYTQTSWANILRGVPGLLVDQQFGAIANAPVFCAAVVGTLALAFARRSNAASAPAADAPSPRAIAAMLVVTFAPYMLVTASYHMWWGGTSAPARFLVPVLWTAALPAAVAWHRARAAADRAVWLGLLGLTAVMTAAMTQGGGGLLAFTTRATHGPFEEWATRAVDLSMALPSLLRDTPLVAVEVAGAWALALIAWWLALRVIGTTTARAAAWAVPLGVAAASAAFSGVWIAREVEPVRPHASRRAALDAAWHDGIGITFQRAEIDGRRRRSGLLRVDDVLPLLELRSMTRERPPGAQLLGLSALPAGDYRVRVAGAEPRQGRVRVEVGRGGVIEVHDLAGLPVGRDGRPWFDLSLPIDVHAFTVVAEPGSTATFATLSATRLYRGGERASGDSALVARRYPGADIFFTTDGQYVETLGLWVKAGGTVPMVVRPREAGVTAVPIFVRNGPKPNVVWLSDGAWEAALALAPGQETVVEWPWAEDSRARLLEVHADEAFRPADVNPASEDFRRLGAWIEFR